MGERPIRSGTVIVVLVLLTCTGCGRFAGSTEDRTTPSVRSEGVTATRAVVGPVGRPDSVVGHGSTVLVLASTTAVGSGDTLLRSADAGETWTTSVMPFPSPVGQPPTDSVITSSDPRLMWAGGDVFVATRTSKGADDGLVQDVAVSTDAGAFWHIVSLEGPDGRRAVVNDAVVHAGELVLVGASTTSPEGGGVSPGALADAAVWAGPVDAASFLFVADPIGVDDGTQVLRDVAETAGGLVVIGGDSRRSARGEQCCFTWTGPVSYGSVDARSWSALSGLEDPNDVAFVPLQQDGDELALGLTLGRYVLQPGASAWTVQAVPGVADEFTRSDIGQGLWAPIDGADLVTTVMDSACDCSIAKAGRVDTTTGSLTDLGFDGCDDTSVRGETWIGAPHVIGRTGLADAACNDRGRNAGAVAVTTDGGRNWSSVRLDRIVPEGFDQFQVAPYADRSAVTDESMFTVGNAWHRSAAQVHDGGSDPMPHGPIVVVRVTPS